jgi:hypothetical protein
MDLALLALLAGNIGVWAVAWARGAGTRAGAGLLLVWMWDMAVRALPFAYFLM